MLIKYSRELFSGVLEKLFLTHLHFKMICLKMCDTKFSKSKTVENRQSLVSIGSRQVKQHVGDQPPDLLAGLHVAPDELAHLCR